MRQRQRNRDSVRAAGAESFLCDNDKAGVVFERKRYRVDGDVLFPNRMIFQIDRYATKEKRKDEKYQISAKDLLSTDNVMSEEQYKHSIK